MVWKLDAEHKPNHTSYALYFHVVWATARREPLIDQPMARFLQEFFPKECSELEVHLLEQGILCDHVHLLLSMRPIHYIPEVVDYLKGVASFEANNQHSFINSLYWTRGYHINSVSERSLPAAGAYVCDQFRRHPDKIPAPAAVRVHIPSTADESEE
jgi:putative transposase